MEKIRIVGFDPDEYEEIEEEKEASLKIVSGDFVEGETVTVEICGKQYTRKVKYSARKWADLYITINGHEITYSEFYEPDAFKDTDYAAMING